MDRFRDVKEFFTVKKGISQVQLKSDVVSKSAKSFETKYNKAELSSGKSDDLSKDKVLSLKNDIAEIMSNIPQGALNKMIKCWHMFRLNCSV